MRIRVASLHSLALVSCTPPAPGRIFVTPILLVDEAEGTSSGPYIVFWRGWSTFEHCVKVSWL
jgi:hypothetical protein